MVVTWLGDGAYGTVYEVEMNGKLYAVKTNTRSDHDTEHRAYKKISSVPQLQDYVCGFYGEMEDAQQLLSHHSPRFRHALRLQRLYGTHLDEALWKMTRSERAAIRKHLEHALDLLHTRARLCHGDIHGANVIVTEHGEARLFDFGHAQFRENMDDDRWNQRVYCDRSRLAGLFQDADYAEEDEQQEAGNEPTPRMIEPRPPPPAQTCQNRHSGHSHHPRVPANSTNAAADTARATMSFASQ